PPPPTPARPEGRAPPTRPPSRQASRSREERGCASNRARSYSTLVPDGMRKASARLLRALTREGGPSIITPLSPFPPMSRGGAVWSLVGLITQRSQVQILPPQPIETKHLRPPERVAVVVFLGRS